MLTCAKTIATLRPRICRSKRLISRSAEITNGVLCEGKN